MIGQDALIEYAQYVENYYGTPRKYVEEQLSAGKDVILEIEIQGAMKIREKFPDTLLVFVCPPSMEELKNRLVGRGTETLDVINGRLRRAVEESRGMDKYDYLLINDDLEECVDTLHETIRCERMRTSRNHDFPLWPSWRERRNTSSGFVFSFCGDNHVVVVSFFARV